MGNRIRSLNGLKSNIGEPGSAKHKLLDAIVYSTMLYAAPILETILNFRTQKEILERLQRRMALRVVYRTTSTISLQVILNDVPIDLNVRER